MLSFQHSVKCCRTMISNMAINNINNKHLHRTLFVMNVLHCTLNSSNNNYNTFLYLHINFNSISIQMASIQHLTSTSVDGK